MSPAKSSTLDGILLPKPAMFITRLLRRSAVAIGLVLVLHACGGGDNGSPTAPGQSSVASSGANFKVATRNGHPGIHDDVVEPRDDQLHRPLAAGERVGRGTSSG